MGILPKKTVSPPQLTRPYDAGGWGTVKYFNFPSTALTLADPSAVEPNNEYGLEEPPTSDVAGSIGTETGHSVVTKTVFSLISLLSVAVACAVVTTKVADEGQAGVLASPSEQPVEGLTIFAVFFVAALGIERLLEPISRAIVAPIKSEKRIAAEQAEAKWIEDLADATTTQGRWVSAVQEVIDHVPAKESPETTAANDAAKKVTAAATTAQTSANETATAVAKHETASLGGALLLWTLATIVSMLAAAKLNLYFLHTIGISSGPLWIEILATGLIIGAGTKPLHDLIELISKKKDAADAVPKGS